MVDEEDEEPDDLVDVELPEDFGAGELRGGVYELPLELDEELPDLVERTLEPDEEEPVVLLRGVMVDLLLEPEEFPRFTPLLLSGV